MGKGMSMRNTDEKKEFVAFIQQLRKEKGVTLSQVCHGVCSEGAVAVLEREGDWRPDRLLQECLLERLGIAAEDYIHLLDLDTYTHQEDRQHILHNIIWGDMDSAYVLLEAYEKKYLTENPLEMQFFLVMKAQIRRNQGCPEEELGRLFESAACVTMSGADEGNLKDKMLSVKELDILLETERYQREGKRPNRYREIVNYIEGYGLDKVGQAKVYPKAIYYMCQSVINHSGERDGWEEEALLQYCDKGIKVLQESGRMYYLWELLELEERLVSGITEDLYRQGKWEKVQVLDRKYGEHKKWKRALERLYGEYGIHKETRNSCHLYVMQGVRCINDVIRIRRKMFGISQAKLCEGICSVKTLRRLEQKKTCTQREIAIQLLQRLGLSEEYSRTDLVTEKPEVRRLMERLREMLNKGEWEDADRLLRYVKRMVSMKIPVNRQTLEGKELLIRWREGKIDREEYCAGMKELLELSLPYSLFLTEGEKYLTEEEQTCILNWMLGMEDEAEKLQCLIRLEELYEPYIESKMIEIAWNMYEFVANNIGSTWGNMGKYDRADGYSSFLLEGCLRLRRMEMIHRSLYDRWWNHDMRRKAGIPTDKVLSDEEELAKCILFSALTGDNRGQQFYQEKIKTISKK